MVSGGSGGGGGIQACTEALRLWAVNIDRFKPYQGVPPEFELSFIYI